MERDEKKKEGPHSPSPVRKKAAKAVSGQKDKNWMQNVLETKKSLEDNNEKEQKDEPLVGGYDSDNELDYEHGKQIDNTQPLKDEKGRDKIRQTKPVAAFKSLFSSDICNSLKRFGGSPAPLSLIGTFLNYVGNNVLYYIHDKFKKRVFYPFSEVISVKHLPSGEMLTTVNTKIDGIDLKLQFRSKAVVMSNGGKPSIPKEIYSGVPKEKLITADFLLRKNGYDSFMTTLTKNPKKRKIVIIGGSHSGFSSAWVLLNGPACFNHNKNG